jgi:hypothetical protein
MFSRRKQLASIVLLTTLSLPLLSQAISVSGRVTDSQGNGLPNALVELICHDSGGTGQALVQTISGTQGQFEIEAAAAGKFNIKVHATGFKQVTVTKNLLAGGRLEIAIQMRQIDSRVETVTVTADVNATDVVSPDPAEKVFIRDELLDANPGRPGAPVSIPGYPIETASRGIKAPQYFAPGVAGDHGEPIAQYIAVGSYLVPNNLSANAHGNGYSDPNIFIPQVLESVQVDGEAFNVEEGNHSVNLAATHGLRSRLDPFFTFTGDYPTSM